MARVLLTKEDFEQLITGGIVSQNGVEIALQDIGYVVMQSIIERAKEGGSEDPDLTRLFILTDSCMWEANRQQGTKAPHSVEVIDSETGKSRYIKSGSRIRFVSGDISEEYTQEEYNRQHDRFDAMKAESDKQ